MNKKTSALFSAAFLAAATLPAAALTSAEATLTATARLAGDLSLGVAQGGPISSTCISTTVRFSPSRVV